ncbi:hypothetical protein GDO86_017669 [Hymenochirus boettgeri]|uniref:Elongin-B n=1 Tax=Hymenochirus boettgeri TaxID=247094 RepID=A0A8T2INC6_9PIPI|nr:hypothetical protein GDO86_017669 [Hymenochirus boettgeri]
MRGRGARREGGQCIAQRSVGLGVVLIILVAVIPRNGLAGMDVFLMIRRLKTTIFTDAKENTTVYELKRIVEGILKRPPEDQRLYKDDQLLDDNKTLGDCGFTSQTARPQAPATVGLAFRSSGDSFEPLRVDSFSSPPELPDVMKPQETSGSANEQAVQ